MECFSLIFHIKWKWKVPNDQKEIVLNYKLNTAPAQKYTIYSIVFYEQTVKIDVLGNELILYK